MDKQCNCPKPEILISQVFHASPKKVWTIEALMSGAVICPALKNAGKSRVCLASEPLLYRVAHHVI